MDLSIIDATKEDALFVAKCTLAAIQLYDFISDSSVNEKFVEVCKSENTLFSFKNARIAILNGKQVGAIVAYSGKFYQEARQRTYKDIFPGSDYECNEDEFYLDSMAVIPEARGLKVGKLLMVDAITRGYRMGFRKMSLIILKEPNHENLKQYYSYLGFTPIRDITFFGKKYTKMIKKNFYRHLVLWKFQGNLEQRIEHAKWMKKNLENLLGTIPGLLSAEVLIGAEENQKYDALLDSLFVSKESMKLYKIHPDYVKISEYCKSHREDRVSFDALQD